MPAKSEIVIKTAFGKRQEYHTVLFALKNFAYQRTVEWTTDLQMNREILEIRVKNFRYPYINYDGEKVSRYFTWYLKQILSTFYPKNRWAVEVMCEKEVSDEGGLLRVYIIMQE